MKERNQLKYTVVLQANNVILGKDISGYFWSKIGTNTSIKHNCIYKVNRLNISENDISEAIKFLINKGER